MYKPFRPASATPAASRRLPLPARTGPTTRWPHRPPDRPARCAARCWRFRADSSRAGSWVVLPARTRAKNATATLNPAAANITTRHVMDAQQIKAGEQAAENRAGDVAAVKEPEPGNALRGGFDPAGNGRQGRAHQQRRRHQANPATTPRKMIPPKPAAHRRVNLRDPRHARTGWRCR